MSDYATLMRLRHACAGIVSLSNPDDFVSNGEWKRAVAELEAAFESYSPAVTKLTAERDAARENHLKVMKERDAAFGLLDSFRNAHVQEHHWGAGVCHLCLAAEKLTKP